LKERLSVQEFYSWETFYLSEPFLPERVDMGAALISSVLANVNRGKGQKVFTMSDFMVISNSLKESSTNDQEAAEERHFIQTMMAFGGIG
jgi:Protein of unknown function (DUF4035)